MMDHVAFFYLFCTCILNQGGILFLKIIIKGFLFDKKKSFFYGKLFHANVHLHITSKVISNGSFK
jgi:hypothetical protein